MMREKELGYGAETASLEKAEQNSLENMLHSCVIEGEAGRISFPHIMEHAIGNAVAEIVPALRSVLQLKQLPLPVFELVFHADLAARDLAAKANALAEVFGPEDVISKVRFASYDIKQFFEAFTEQVNQGISDKLRGDIQFTIAENSETGVTFDARRVTMILYQLISNALQHGRTQNKHIKLHGKATADRFELSVRDYGGGVPEEVLPVLFTKFKEEFNLKRQLSGLMPPRLCGLGLPLCRKLVKDMEGELLFKNLANGAKFTIVLPQKTNRMRETSVFYPDDTLMRNCMAGLFLQMGK